MMTLSVFGVKSSVFILDIPNPAKPEPIRGKTVTLQHGTIDGKI
jgi:hypothetical protein